MSAHGLFLVRMDVAHDHEAVFNDVYDREHVPNLRGVPGVQRASRYRQPSRNRSQVMVTASFAVIAGNNVTKILPSQTAVAPSSRESNCLMRSQETVTKVGSRTTSDLLVVRFSGRVTVSDRYESRRSHETNEIPSIHLYSFEKEGLRE